MFAKLTKFILSNAAQRGRALRNKQALFAGLLRRAIPFGGPTYWAYRPDSDWLYAEHPEAKALLPKWLHGNRTNNAGDLARFYALILNVKQIIRERVPGDFAELGVYRGNSAAVLAHFANSRRLFLFDTFSGFDRSDLVGVDREKPIVFTDTSTKAVRELVGEDALIVPGLFPASVTAEAETATYAFVHLDCDLYKPMRDGLAFFYERLSSGGMILVHDYSSGAWPGTTEALDEFCLATGERPALLPDKSGTAVIRKRHGRISSTM